MKKMLALLLAAAMIVSLAACGSSSSSSTDESSDSASADTETVQEDVEISIGTTYWQAIGAFDSTGLYVTPTNISSLYLVYDVTFLRNADGELESEIFSDYYVTDDESEIVLVLRDDVEILFSNGDAMTGEDVAYSLYYASQNQRTSSDWAYLDIDGITVSDDGMTITIPFNIYRGDWTSVMYAVPILNKSWYEDDLGGMDNVDFTDPESVCGSGPYAAEEYVEDLYTSYVKRDDWWQEGENEDEAQASKITVYYYSDSTTMMVDYENGVIDAALNITDEDYETVSADSSLGTAELISSNENVVLWLDSDHTDALADVNLRIAMSMGTNAADIAAVTFGSLGTAADAYLSSGLTDFYTEGTYVYEYDPETAAAMVEELGYTGLELDVICASGTSATIFEAWAAQMAEIGITINLNVEDTITFLEDIQTPGATCAMLAGSDNENISGDPSQSINVVLADTESTQPAEAKQDEYLNELVTEAANKNSSEERKEAYATLQEYLYEMAYGIPLAEWYEAYCYGASGKITGMSIYVARAVNLRCIQVY